METPLFVYNFPRETSRFSTSISYFLVYPREPPNRYRKVINITTVTVVGSYELPRCLFGGYMSYIFKHPIFQHHHPSFRQSYNRAENIRRTYHHKQNPAGWWCLSNPSQKYIFKKNTKEKHHIIAEFILGDGIYIYVIYIYIIII